jgi:hypothetical protein
VPRSLTVTLVVVTAAAAQPAYHDPSYPPTVPHDGRFTFARLRWKSDRRSGFRGFASAWNHDHPRAEQHLGQIVKELTYLDVQTAGSRVLTLDDPSRLLESHES